MRIFLIYSMISNENTVQHPNAIPPFKMGWSEISVLAGGFIFGQIATGILALILGSASDENVLKSSWFMPIAYLFTMGFPLVVFYFTLLKPKGFSFPLPLKGSNFIVSILALAMMIGMMLVSEFIVSLIPISGPWFGSWYESFSEQMESISTSTISMVVMTVVFAPILEELLFRGIILKGMLNKGVNPKNAILISALIFGAIHGYPWQAVGAFFLGIILGWIYERTESLLLPIMLHAFNNGIASIMISNLKTESFSAALHTSDFIILAIGAVVLSISAYYFYQKTNSNTTNFLSK